MRPRLFKRSVVRDPLSGIRCPGSDPCSSVFFRGVFFRGVFFRGSCSSVARVLPWLVFIRSS